jgi:hypothetical protein
MSFQDHWQLTTILCSNFPQTYHKASSSIVTMGVGDLEVVRPFKDISAFFQAINELSYSFPRANTHLNN